MGRDPIGACCTHGPSQSCPPTRASSGRNPRRPSRDHPHAHAVLEGRYAEAIRGGESVFYYQPGFRYIQAANLAFFGPSSAGAVLAAALVTVALLGLSRRFLPNGRDWPILLLWLLPILSAFDAAAVGLSVVR